METNMYDTMYNAVGCYCKRNLVKYILTELTKIIITFQNIEITFCIFKDIKLRNYLAFQMNIERIYYSTYIIS